MNQQNRGESLYETEEKQETIILVAVSTDGENDIEESLDELEELVNTAGAVVVGRITQNLEHRNSATYIGTGKVQELKELIQDVDADAIVCDDCPRRNIKIWKMN